MITSIWEDLKREFSYGSIVTRLIIINATVFVVINLANIFLSIGGASGHFTDVLHFFCISSDLWVRSDAPLGDLFSYVFA